MCKHLWTRDGFGKNARERYYCQKCLMLIDIERWKDSTEVFVISEEVEVNQNV